MVAQILLGIIVVVLMVIGIVAIVKPEWVTVIDRRYKATGTTSRPGEIELNETYYLVVRIVGVGMILTGLAYGVQIL